MSFEPAQNLPKQEKKKVSSRINSFKKKLMDIWRMESI